MTLRELFELLQDVYAGNERDFSSRTVRVSVGGMTGAVARLEWRYGDPVLVAERQDKPVKPVKPARSDGPANKVQEGI